MSGNANDIEVDLTAKDDEKKVHEGALPTDKDSERF